MTVIQCPRCGGGAAGASSVWGDKKPYCPACGWNVDRANTLGGKNQKALAVWFVAIAIFLAVIGATSARSANQHFGSFVVFGFILVVLALISWRRSKSQKSSRAAAAVISPPPRVTSAPTNSASATYERLLMLRRPRAIRLKTSMRIFVIVYAVILGSAGYGVFLAAARGGNKADFHSLFPNLFPLVMFALIWALIAATMFRSIVRDRSLLIDGEIAIGTVTSQSYAGGENRESRIVYDFKDAAGRAFSGKSTDRTRKLFEEMQTPVFYDPANPDKNVALAGATYDVIDT
jgi:uncharacterized protein (DUF983 family)